MIKKSFGKTWRVGKKTFRYVYRGGKRIGTSPVFKIESVVLRRRDANFSVKQQLVDTMSDELVEPQILQVHTAITENTNIHLAVHNKFYNSSNCKLPRELPG